MNNILAKFDAVSGIASESERTVWLERLAFLFLVLMTVSAPHSIAASQASWILGMLFWMLRMLVSPRPGFKKTFLFVPFAAFLGWSVVSSLFSHAPDISVDRLRNVAILFVFFFAVNNLRSLRAVRFVAIALLLSTMINVVWVPVERLIGRGVEIHGISEQSPLRPALFREGDALLTANGKKVAVPEDIVKEIDFAGSARIELYRPDYYQTYEIKKDELLDGSSANERLGITTWKVSRNWRSAGFFGHYATYAEVIQLIGSLAFGLLIACLFPIGTNKKKWPAFNRNSVLLMLATGLMALALLLTVTRASQAAFMFSAFLITATGAGRKWFLLMLALMIPVVIGGLIFLQQSRNTGFLDTSDNSTTWRQTVYREGFDLWSNSPRHVVFGIGMDSLKRFAKDWKFFDNGKLPPGHFHSTPLQILFERGLPALIFWIWIFVAYLSKLFRYLRRGTATNWFNQGILLGAFGGAAGFFLSGLVHYNLGDGEVAMVFYLIMGLAVATITDRQSGAREPDLR